MTGGSGEFDKINDGGLGRRQIDLSSLWAQATSDFGGIFDPETASSSDVFTDAPAIPTIAASSASGEMTPRSEVMPISTVTVEETSLSTTFVTVRFTTDLTPTYAPVPATEPSSDSMSSTESSVQIVASSTSSTRTHFLPSLATSTTSAASTTLPAALPTDTPDDAAASAANSTPNSSPGTQKHAIIGGLSGSLAGIVLMGLIACLCWRRRKPRFEDDDAESEKGMRPAFIRKLSDMRSAYRAPRPPPTAVTSRRSTPEPEIDGQVLRVSLDNWARPYAHDQGLRESQGPTTLRVMNPDLSRPSTPRRPSLETAGSFLKRQRNALAAALHGRPSSRPESPQRNLQVPASHIDPALSTEFLAPKAIAPSVRSGSTNASTAIVVQQPPEDPFLTPPDETEERAEYTTRPPPAARPGIAPLQGAAATAGGLGRTLSHLGSSLNPFRTRSNASASSRSASRHSVSTFSSAGDPFYLQSNYGVHNKRDRVRGTGGGSVMMYEGT